MSEMCPKCPGCDRDWSQCGEPFLPKCLVAGAYNRGLREGVALAKELVENWCGEGCGKSSPDEYDWSDVDAELARRVGGE